MEVTSGDVLVVMSTLSKPTLNIHSCLCFLWPHVDSLKMDTVRGVFQWCGRTAGQNDSYIFRNFATSLLEDLLLKIT